MPTRELVNWAANDPATIPMTAAHGAILERSEAVWLMNADTETTMHCGSNTGRRVCKVIIETDFEPVVSPMIF